MSQPPRIQAPPALHVAVAGWLLGPPSGANRRLLALLGRIGPQLRTDERVTVLHTLADRDVPPLPGMHWHRVPIAANPTWRRLWHERRTLAATIRALGATVLDHGFLPLPPVDVPIVWTLHDLRGPAGLTRWPRWLATAAVRRAAQQAAATVVPSAFTRDELLRLYPQARCVVIPNGVTMPAAQTNLSARTAPVLHVGHLEPRKNLAILLHALALLPPNSRPPLRLLGRDAGQGAALRALASRLGIAGQVTFGGVVDEATLAREYAAARAVVVPSRYEGFGLAALEGLAHGKPVLVADAGALPEVVGEVGLRLPPDDAAAWAQALATLTEARDDTAEAAAAAAQRAHAATFDWARSAAQVLDLWRQANGR